MSNAFELQLLDDRLATLTFDQPDRSVNVFTRRVLRELEEHIDRLASREEDIGCLVLLSGKEETFIAGADLDEIAGVSDPLEAEAGSRLGQRLFASWAALPFPTVAAIRGTCVGGGTELALASTYIVASDRDGVSIGLPETRLGILPGWGGCTRLPRRVGIADALDLILSGKTVDGRKAFKLGLADALFPDAAFGHLVRDFALAHLDTREKHSPDLSFQDVLLEKNPVGRKILFDQARKRTLGKTRGHYPAPLRALEVVRLGVEQGMEAGFDAEARAVGELAISPVCKNLVHVFRLTESAKKVEGEAREVRQAAVLGAGTMGGGIAQLVAYEADIPVRLKDIDLAPLASAMKHASGLFRKLVDKRRLSEPEAGERLGLIRPSLSYDGLARCDLVVEAVVEKLELKQQVFAEVAEAAPEAVLATNTSSLSIDRIAADVSRPERVVGMHFFHPVHKMPLVEVVVGPRTGDAEVLAVRAFARRLGKTPVVVEDGPGFLVNRLLMFYSAEAMWLLDEGHRIQDLDRAMKDWGMPMGPFEVTDEVGIDVAVKVARIMADAFPDRLPLPSWLDRPLEDDRLGAKSGRGFYRYEDGGRNGPDEAVYDLLGIQAKVRDPNLSYLVDRMVLPMVNEAARCLGEGIVAGPGELDVAMILGTGFPPFRDGLCRWADQQGLTALMAEMERLATDAGERYLPSDPLRRAAESGGFYATDWS